MDVFLGELPRRTYQLVLKGFAHIAAPLHALAEKLKPWEWTGLCDEAFVQL